MDRAFTVGQVWPIETRSMIDLSSRLIWEPTMTRKLTILAAALIGCSALASVAEAAFVLKDTLKPRDAAPSVRAILEEVTEGALVLDSIEGIHHPRTSNDPSQANSVTIYARVSGELPSRLPGRPPEQFDNDFLTFSCDQLEDRRWICPTIFLGSLVGLVTRSDYFFLER
jgi:hypothetical protein